MKIKKTTENRKELNKAIATNEVMTTISASVIGCAGNYREVADCVSIEVETKSIEDLTPLKIAKLITKLEKFDDMVNSFDSIEYNDVCISILSEDEYVNICNVKLVGFEPVRSKVEQFDSAIAYLSVCNNADHKKLDEAMKLSDEVKIEVVELFTDSRFDTLEGFVIDYLSTTILTFECVYKDTHTSYTKAFDSAQQASEYRELFDKRTGMIEQYKQNPTDENGEIIKKERCEKWEQISDDIFEAYQKTMRIKYDDNKEFINSYKKVSCDEFISIHRTFMAVDFEDIEKQIEEPVFDIWAEKLGLKKGWQNDVEAVATVNCETEDEILWDFTVAYKEAGYRVDVLNCESLRNNFISEKFGFTIVPAWKKCENIEKCIELLS